MRNICCLDSDDCLSLETISEAFQCGIKEEQSWALIYQSLVSLKDYIKQKDGFYKLCETNKLLIRNNGTIHEKSWFCSSENCCHKLVDLPHLISSIGAAVYKALDYGVSEEEEVDIPTDLEDMFTDMTPNDNIDEGIHETDDSESKSIMDSIQQKCEKRVNNSLKVGEHYRNVCRALVAEAIELSTFLKQITKGTQELKKIKNVDNNEEVNRIQVEVWAHLWMKVMRQLRSGVSLKTVDKTELISSKQREYELTPFEILLDDINSKRYSLKKVELPKQVEKDARSVILEFIRSRPPLKRATERVLSPLREEEPCLHQKIMDGIKQKPRLKPSPKPFERKYDSVHLPRGKRFSIYTKHVAIDGPPISTTENHVFQRFSFRNLSLRSTVLNYNLSPTKSDVPFDGTQPSTPTSSRVGVPFWRRLFSRW